MWPCNLLVLMRIEAIDVEFVGPRQQCRHVDDAALEVRLADVERRDRNRHLRDRVERHRAAPRRAGVGVETKGVADLRRR